ncbi:MAG: lysine--tRNA ligase [Candidatus Bilamarchaeaceae archaeon]
MAPDLQDKKGMHWSEIIAEEVIREKSPPYAVLSGMTTSGPLHPGTLCEFMFADAIYKSMKRAAEGEEVRFYFFADILDAFDSIPEPFKPYEAQLAPHLGKPLVHTPDPMECHHSFADHFLAEATDAMVKFGAHPTIIRAEKAYAEGKYDKYSVMFSERKEEIKEIVRISSLRESMPEGWHPIMPICEKCGKVSTTRVASYSEGEYRYSCDQDVKYTKGCGHSGRARISDHKYKLLFRLDWPSRQDFLRISAEGGSVDHHTKGGTLSTVAAVHREFFKKEPPVFYKFGFLKYKGKKYSKSKGIGHTVEELMQVLPIPLLQYALLRPDIQEDKELVLEESTLLPLIADFEAVGGLDANSQMARPERKKLISYALTEGKKWNAPIVDILVTYSIYKDWKKTGEITGDPAGVAYLAPYIAQWLSRGWIPDKYVFELGKGKKAENPALVRKFAGRLRDGMGEEDVQALVFSTAKENGASPAALFKDLYTVLIGKPMGPRFGKFAAVAGIGRIKSILSAA